MPEDLSPTGPLPLGWHRVVWTDKEDGAQHAYTDNIASAVLALVGLKQSDRIVPDSVKIESWSDYPSGIRDCEINHPGAPCPG